MATMNKIRLPLLAVICTSIVLTLGASVLNLKVGDRQFALSENPSLDDWQLANTEAISTKPQIAAGEEPPSESVTIARRYQYTQGDRSLNVEMRYIPISYGQIVALIPAYTAIGSREFISDTAADLQESNQSIGAYNLFTYQNKAYLSACITPQGQTTADQVTFLANLKATQSLKANLLPWALGKKPLRDRRCLWTHMYMDLGGSQNISEQQAYETLEASLGNLSQWWRSQLQQS
jgi:cyanosortase A-associated protein